MAVGLGTSISLAFVVVVILFVVILKTRHKKLSSQNEINHTSNGYQSTEIGNSGVRTIYNGLFGNYENETKSTSERCQSTQIENSMYEYESVTVKEVVKEDGETVEQICRYDSIKIKGIIYHNGQQRPDRKTADYENFFIFRK